MIDEGDSLNLLALLVALVALCTSLGQLLQAIFGTADGYRRCQSSVIGPWAKFTRLRWRWRELRFETRFTTPWIGFGGNEAIDECPGVFSLLDAKSPAAQVLLDSGKITNTIFTVDNPELAGWVCLLGQLWDHHAMAVLGDYLHSSQDASRSGETLTECPTLPAQCMKDMAIRIKLVERSWNLMPAELVRELVFRWLPLNSTY
jgi:hypothetical protein